MDENAKIVAELWRRDLNSPEIISALADMAVNTKDLKLCEKVKQKAAEKALKFSSDRRGVAFMNIYWQCVLMLAPHKFDDYMLYLEKERAPAERFYAPRRKVLKRAVDALQKLADDELDELFISMPPRVGKTTLLLFYVTWIIGRDSELSNLYSAYSDIITGAFFTGIFEIIGDADTYTFSEIFPQREVVAKNAQLETIDFDRKKRYPSFTARSLYGTLNGACDCKGMLISDDLIGGIEEALNPDRLRSAWSKVDNNLLTRAKESAKILWLGTRWSMIDPAGLRMELLKEDEKFKDRRYEVINLPALNDSDESNFDYDYGVGFTTEYYHLRRASFEKNNDMASWSAQYMGMPIEREGALFEPDDMNYYNGVLPEGEPDRVILYCDVALGGGDYLSAPIGKIYGDACYIDAVIFDPHDKKITEPRLVKAIMTHKVTAAEFEADAGGDGVKCDVEQMLKDAGYRLNITSRRASNQKSKKDRIFDKAPEIREFYYLESGKRDKDYSLFMQNLFMFKILGKIKNDDAPDSLAGLAKMKNDTRAKTVIMKRLF